MAEQTTGEKVLRGIGASPGICIGKAYLVDTEGVDIVGKFFIPKENLEKEVKRFKRAVQHVIDEMETIIAECPTELKDKAEILEAHSQLLKDKRLYDKTIATIESEAINAEWALNKVTTALRRMFKNMNDDYLRARADDIAQVSERILRRLAGAETVNIATIDKRVVLVAHDLSPAETSQIHLERIKGFITDRGGRASHTSIIARTLEIPAVTGLGNASKIIRQDDLLIVDGNTGTVIVQPAEQTLMEFEEKKMGYERYRSAITKYCHLPARTKDGHELKIMGNIELPEEVVPVIDNGGDGIGLYRTEFQYMAKGRFPTEEELFDRYRDVVEVMHPRPVTFRTLDINGDKTVRQIVESGEPNPALGLRAIRYCLKNPSVFQPQLRAILRASAFGNVRILLPMISSCQEILQARAAIKEAVDTLQAEGIRAADNVEIGIMIEVPAAVVMADVMAKMVDFFSIGTNDLIQYTLAIDRDNKDVAHLYHPLQPAILRMLKRTAEAAKDNGIKVFMCGEMAGNPLHAPILLGLGLDELSMNPQSIPAVKNMIRSLDTHDAENVLDEVLQHTTVEAALELLRQRYGDLVAAMLYDQ